MRKKYELRSNGKARLLDRRRAHINITKRTLQPRFSFASIFIRHAHNTLYCTEYGYLKTAQLREPYSYKYNTEFEWICSKEHTLLPTKPLLNITYSSIAMGNAVTKATSSLRIAAMRRAVHVVYEMMSTCHNLQVIGKLDILCVTGILRQPTM